MPTPCDRPTRSRRSGPGHWLGLLCGQAIWWIALVGTIVLTERP